MYLKVRRHTVLANFLLPLSMVFQWWTPLFRRCLWGTGSWIHCKKVNMHRLYFRKDRQCITHKWSPASEVINWRNRVKSSSKLCSSIENTFDADFPARFNKYLFTHLPTADPEVSFWKKFAEQNGFLTMPNFFAFYITLTVSQEPRMNSWISLVAPIH